MKRFYKSVSLEEDAGRARLLLDGRQVQTPGKNEMAIPAGLFAEAVGDEWRAQGEEIDPGTMPLTRLANSVIDGVVEQADEVRQSIAAYGKSDLVCYRAETPQDLVARQAACLPM